MPEPRTNDSATTAERKSPREWVVTHTCNAPAPQVFAAWTRPELLTQWWMPKSFGITFISCEADVRTGGTYRFVFGHPAAPEPMAFFGRYLEVIPDARIVWTNEEGGEGGQVTTVTCTATDGTTRIVMHDLYPSPEALDAAIASGSTGGCNEQFAQLDELLAAAPTPEAKALRDAYAALNRNDPTVFAALLAPDAEYTEPANFAGTTHHGAAAVTRLLIDRRADWAEGTCEPQCFAVAGDRIIVSAWVHVRLRHETGWRTGHISDAFIFRAGKLARWRTFLDDQQARTWAGFPAAT